jgi:glycogen(starch) synthase
METGFIADERVNELLAACDALLMPYTDFNSQSGVAVIAGMAGRPVIAAPAGGIADLIAAGLAAVEIPTPVDLDGVTEVDPGLLRHAQDGVVQSRGPRPRPAEPALAWPRIGRQLAGLFD